jgi:hypothetical protein
MNATEMLKQLELLVSPTPDDPWKEYIELIRDGGIEDAAPWGFAVRGETGRTEVTLDGGLKPQHYQRLAPLVTDDEKSILAAGVLQNMLQPIHGSDWQTAMHMLCEAYGDDESLWLPAMVESHGFSAIADELRERLTQYRRFHRPSRRKLDWVEHPVWHGPKIRVLEYGQHKFTFRSDADVQMKLLAELERNGWKPINCSDQRNQEQPGRFYLDPDQVRDAAKALRRKTLPYINWHAGADGELSWDAP